METTLTKSTTQRKAGKDSDMFEFAYRNYFTKLEAYAATLSDPDNARDIVQDVFLHMWNTIDEFRNCSSIYAYLRRMIYSRCIDQIRHQRIAGKYISEAIYLTDISRNDVEMTVFYRELNVLYNHVLAQMPGKRRAVFLLQQTSELSLADISRQMDISVKTVDCHLANARKTLRQRLRAYQV